MKRSGVSLGVVLALALWASAVCAGGMPDDIDLATDPPQPSAAGNEVPEDGDTTQGIRETPARATAIPEDVDLAAVLPAADDASEYWDLLAVFESGEQLTARMLVTNIGPGERTALAFGHWRDAAGNVTPFKNGKRSSNWTLSAGRTRLVVGSSVLALGPKVRHFEVDNDKRGIKIFVDIEADATAIAAPERFGSISMSVLNLGSPTSARVQVADMSTPVSLRGRALLTHTVARRDEGAQVSRRVDAAVLRGHRLLVTHMEPATQGAPPWTFVVHAPRGRPASVWPGVRVTLSRIPGEKNAYPIPDRIALSGNALGHIQPGAVRLTVDPLGALPTLLKMVYPFRRSPRHVWTRGNADVERVSLQSDAGETAFRIRGQSESTLIFQDAIR